MSLRRSRRNTFTEEIARPKSSEPRPTSIDDNKSQEDGGMRRASTNNNLMEMEMEAAKVTAQDWSKLMGMVNRNSDGHTVMGDEAVLNAAAAAGTSPSQSAFVRHEKTASVPEYPSFAALSPSHPVSLPSHQSASQIPSLTISKSGNSPVKAPFISSSALSPSGISSSTLSPSSGLASTSSAPLSSAFATLRREGRTSTVENRLKLRREKEQYMARAIMEEEHRKVAREKERVKEADDRMKEKERIRELQEQQLHAYYEQMEKQQSPQPQQQPHADDNLTYFRSMKKKIKDINVPSIGLDEKLKRLNTRVKGFLATNPPSFSLPIQKFKDRDKKAPKPRREGMPIKMNVVDEFMKDLELQRSMRDTNSMEIPLSPSDVQTSYEVDSNASSPAEAQKKHAGRARRRTMRINSDLRVLTEALESTLQKHNDELEAAHTACTRLRVDMEATKKLTVDAGAMSSKVSRASLMGQQFSTTVQEIRSQLDTIKGATSSCSDQIKLLEVRVQKVQRAKKKSDVVMKYIARFVGAVILLYLLVTSRVFQVLGVISVFILAIRMMKDKNILVTKVHIPDAPPISHHPLPPQSPEWQREEEEINPDPIPSSVDNAGITPKQNITPPISAIRRNRSDLVLQSLLNEDEFAEVFAGSESPKAAYALPTLVEQDERAESLSAFIRNNSPSHSPVTAKGIAPDNRSGPRSAVTTTIRSSGSSAQRAGSAGPSARSTTGSGGIRTSSGGSGRGNNPPDSAAMNLALHNLNQMSLKIQQMQQGK